MLEPDDVPQPQGLEIRQIGGNRVLSSFHTGISIEVNDDGARILGLVDGARSIREMAERLGCGVERLKPFLEELQRLGFLAGSPRDSSRLTVEWDITYRCNLRCSHCLVEAGDPATYSPGDEMDTKTALKLCDDLAEAGFRVLVVSGGEPLLRGDWHVILKHAARRGLYTKMMTNGTLITDTIARQLREGDVIYVQMSLDGANAATHDQLRGPGTFEATVRGARCLIRHGIAFGLGTVVFRENEHQLQDIADLAFGLGARAWLPGELLPRGRAAKCWKWLRPEMSASELDCTVFRIFRRNKTRMRIGSYIGSIRRSYELAKRGLISVACSRLYRGFAVAPNGETAFCKGFFGKCDLGASLGESDYRIGRYPGTPLRKLLQVRDRFLRNVTERRGSQCEGCGFWLLCLGGCAAENFERYRRFLVPRRIRCHNIVRMKKVRELIS